MQTDQPSRVLSRRARSRGAFVALVVVFAAVTAACTPTAGGFNIAIGGTIPLPTIAVPPTFQGGSILGCQLGFNTPGINIAGATATVPGIDVNLGSGTVSVPNITVNLPSIQVQLPSLVTCLGTLDLGTISLPASASATGVLNIATSQLTINATVTIPFSILGISLPIVLPIGPITVNI